MIISSDTKKDGTSIGIEQQENDEQDDDDDNNNDAEEEAVARMEAIL